MKNQDETKFIKGKKQNWNDLIELCYSYQNHLLGEACPSVILDGRQWPIQETDFEKYLERNGLLDWELDYADYEGEHIQQTGKMDLEDYFEQDQRYIKLDLQTYLESKYIVQNITGYINAMVSRFRNVG